MDYEKIYYQLVEKCKFRGTKHEVGYEVHHIVPKSLGGNDRVANLVKFTFKEHFIAHILLTKFTTGSDRYKMLHALSFMRNTIHTSRGFEGSKLLNHQYHRYYSIEQEEGFVNIPLRPLSRYKKVCESCEPFIRSLGFSKKTITKKKLAAMCVLASLCKTLLSEGYKGFCASGNQMVTPDAFKGNLDLLVTAGYLKYTYRGKILPPSYTILKVFEMKSTIKRELLVSRLDNRTPIISEFLKLHHKDVCLERTAKNAYTIRPFIAGDKRFKNNIVFEKYLFRKYKLSELLTTLPKVSYEITKTFNL